MSATLMGAAMSCGPKRGSLRYALVAIADNADDYGFACPSIATIAAKLCCDERTAMRLVQELERQGWVRVCRRVLGGKGSVYFIDITRLGVVEDGRMRRSQMHVEVAKALAAKGSRNGVNSGDKMSRETRSETPYSGDKLSPENPKSSDNPQGSQVTNHAESGDKNRSPLIINHKEPSRNPIPPIAPQGGRTVETPDPDGKQRELWREVNRMRTRASLPAVEWEPWVAQQKRENHWPGHEENLPVKHTRNRQRTRDQQRAMVGVFRGG